MADVWSGTEASTVQDIIQSVRDRIADDATWAKAFSPALLDALLLNKKDDVVDTTALETVRTLLHVPFASVEQAVTVMGEKARNVVREVHVPAWENIMASVATCAALDDPVIGRLREEDAAVAVPPPSAEMQAVYATAMYIWTLAVGERSITRAYDAYLEPRTEETFDRLYARSVPSPAKVALARSASRWLAHYARAQANGPVELAAALADVTPESTGMLMLVQGALGVRAEGTPTLAAGAAAWMQTGVLPDTPHGWSEQLAFLIPKGSPAEMHALEVLLTDHDAVDLVATFRMLVQGQREHTLGFEQMAAWGTRIGKWETRKKEAEAALTTALLRRIASYGAQEAARPLHEVMREDQELTHAVRHMVRVVHQEELGLTRQLVREAGLATPVASQPSDDALASVDAFSGGIAMINQQECVFRVARTEAGRLAWQLERRPIPSDVDVTHTLTSTDFAVEQSLLVRVLKSSHYPSGDGLFGDLYRCLAQTAPKAEHTEWQFDTKQLATELGRAPFLRPQWRDSDIAEPLSPYEILKKRLELFETLDAELRYYAVDGGRHSETAPTEDRGKVSAWIKLLYDDESKQPGDELKPPKAAGGTAFWFVVYAMAAKIRSEMYRIREEHATDPELPKDMNEMIAKADDVVLHLAAQLAFWHVHWVEKNGWRHVLSLKVRMPRAQRVTRMLAGTVAAAVSSMFGLGQALLRRMAESPPPIPPIDAGLVSSSAGVPLITEKSNVTVAFHGSLVTTKTEGLVFPKTTKITTPRSHDLAFLTNATCVSESVLNASSVSKQGYIPPIPLAESLAFSALQETKFVVSVQNGNSTTAPLVYNTTLPKMTRQIRDMGYAVEASVRAANGTITSFTDYVRSIGGDPETLPLPLVPKEGLDMSQVLPRFILQIFADTNKGKFSEETLERLAAVLKIPWAVVKRNFIDASLAVQQRVMGGTVGNALAIVWEYFRALPDTTAGFVDEHGLLEAAMSMLPARPGDAVIQDALLPWKRIVQAFRPPGAPSELDMKPFDDSGALALRLTEESWGVAILTSATRVVSASATAVAAPIVAQAATTVLYQHAGWVGAGLFVLLGICIRAIAMTRDLGAARTGRLIFLVAAVVMVDIASIIALQKANFEETMSYFFDAFMGLCYTAARGIAL